MTNDIRILLIEASPDDEILLLREIRRGGFNISHKRVSSELELHRELKNEWDIIISDFNINGLSGLEALRIARELKPEVPFILVSGTAGEDIAVTAMKAGARDYILKGNTARLASTLEKELFDAEKRIKNRKILVEKETDLRHDQKMEVIGQIAGGLAHDFNNILGIIGLYAENISTLPDQNDGVRSSISGILSAQARGAKLVQQLLTISRKSAFEMQPFDLNLTICGLLDIMKVALGRQHELTLDLCNEACFINGDQNQIEQVMMNLVINARDAMTKEGNLTIYTRIDESTKPMQVILTVSDTGCGMDESTLAKVFEPFFTTKAEGGGTGIGLATVFAIIKQHNAEIVATSKVDRGTQFSITFPKI